MSSDLVKHNSVQHHQVKLLRDWKGTFLGAPYAERGIKGISRVFEEKRGPLFIVEQIVHPQLWEWPILAFIWKTIIIYAKVEVCIGSSERQTVCFTPPFASFCGATPNGSKWHALLAWSPHCPFLILPDTQNPSLSQFYWNPYPYCILHSRLIGPFLWNPSSVRSCRLTHVFE